jgi:hypothetical protein
MIARFRVMHAKFYKVKPSDACWCITPLSIGEFPMNHGQPSTSMQYQMTVLLGSSLVSAWCLKDPKKCALHVACVDFTTALHTI